MTDLGIGVVRPLPGNGLVAHMGGLLLVCDAADAAGADLLEALRETAASGGDGRALARRAAQVLARTMTGDPASCAVAGPVGDGVAVLVSGAATAVISAGDGELRLSGSDSLTWADRLVSGPVRRVELSLPGAGEAHPAARLDGGVVVGGGVLCDLTESAPPPAPVPSRPLSGDRPHGGDRPHSGERSPTGDRAPAGDPRPVTGDVSSRQPDVPAPSRPLTSEMPNTAFHIDPDLVPQRQEPPKPPVIEQHPPVQLAPYPMQGPPSGPQQPSGAHHPSGQQQGQQHGQQGQQGQHPHEVRQGPPSEPIPRIGPSSGPLSAVPPYEEPGQGGTAPEHFDRPYEPQPSSGHGQPSGPSHGQPQGQDDADSRPMVYGVDCKNDHFNDPRLPYCATCGIALVQRTLVPYKGPRPSLGVLVLDDGAALPLEADYLLGRDPERAPEVTGGAARPAKVTSPDGSVSRRHLRVALDGWDVNLVDLGSVNGTQIQPPGDPNFYDIPPNEPVTIAPGTTVRIGVSRTMRFEPQR